MQMEKPSKEHLAYKRYIGSQEEPFPIQELFWENSSKKLIDFSSVLFSV